MFIVKCKLYLFNILFWIHKSPSCLFDLILYNHVGPKMHMYLVIVVYELFGKNEIKVLKVKSFTSLHVFAAALSLYVFPSPGL